MRRIAAILAVALSGCGVVHHRVARAPAPPVKLDLAAFFTGGTRGVGRLSMPVGRARPITVVGTGHIEGDDLLVLDQVVNEGDGPAKRREWRIRQTAPGLWIGSLSDAIGPVVAEVAGPRATITYPMRGGLSVRQTLVAQPDGRTLVNRMEISKAKLHLASIVETIVKQP